MLFEEGQPGDDMYIVVTGEVELRRQIGDTERVLAVLPAGEFFGEMAILNDRPRSATAVVRRDARLFVIDGTTFEAMLRARPEIALRMIKAQSTRLDRANQQVELLLLPTANHRVVQCLRHMAEEQLARTTGQPPPRADAAGRRQPARHRAVRARHRGAGAQTCVRHRDAGRAQR